RARGRAEGEVDAGPGESETEIEQRKGEMTIVYKINGETVTPTEFTKRSRKRQKLHGSIAEICRARRPPAADDDETHTRTNRSGPSYQERELIAKRAKAAGLPEEIAYDP